MCFRTGGLNVPAIARDIPALEGALAREAWVTDNYAHRAAQALSALRKRGGNGGDSEAGAHPSFMPQSASPTEAALTLLKIYREYIREASDFTEGRAYERELARSNSPVG